VTYSEVYYKAKKKKTNNETENIIPVRLLHKLNPWTSDTPCNGKKNTDCSCKIFLDGVCIDTVSVFPVKNETATYEYVLHCTGCTKNPQL
jgi:hypothetical protein